jgi:two-component system, OmpR family, sensor kinase
MSARLRTWLNSMQAHMIGFALTLIVVLTALNVTFVVFAGPPQRTPMTVYDLSRVIRGLPPALDRLEGEFTRSTSKEARLPATAAERQLSGFLAQDLNLPPDHVRLYLCNRSPAYFEYLDKQAAFYARDGRGSPLIDGTVVAAVRQPSGIWNLHVRRSKAGLENYWNLLRNSPWIGFLVMIPLSMWFSAWLARPVRAFVQAASQVGGDKEYPVPVVGPTEVRVAAKALNDMQARVRAFIQERTALVGAIAHDLRTPLNNLRFRIARAPDEVRIPAEGDILQLDGLINSILDYVESDGRALAIEPIDLTSLLQSMVDDLHDRNIAIPFTAVPVQIEGDLLLLRRMFANLIDNAVKFAPHVSIALSTTPAQATVDIADDGPGMSPPDLARAFEPFFRSERSRNRTTGGIGLGLAIAKSVAEAHDGQISLSSAAAGGLRVRVTLPRKHGHDVVPAAIAPSTV